MKDIQDNSKYEGFYINDNEIVKTLDKYFKRGTGNGIARLLFDTSVLLYVDRFCPETYPTKEDLAQFEQFVIYAFIWAYSLRAQYRNLGWLSAQNYIMGESNKFGIINGFNMYQLIALRFPSITSQCPCRQSVHSINRRHKMIEECLKALAPAEK